MNTLLSTILIIIGLLIFLGIIKSAFSFLLNIKLKTIFIIGILVGAGVVYYQFKQDSSQGITGAVVVSVDKAIPEYIDTGLSCKDASNKIISDDTSKEEMCDGFCKPQKNIGNKCINEKFYCNCW